MGYQLSDGAYEGEQLGFVGALIQGLLPVATQAISSRLNRKYRGQVAASNMSVPASQSGIPPSTAARLVVKGPGRGGMFGAMRRMAARQAGAVQRGAVPAPPQALVPAGFTPVPMPIIGTARYGRRMGAVVPPPLPPPPPPAAARMGRRGLDPMMLLAIAVPAAVLLTGRRRR